MLKLKAQERKLMIGQYAGQYRYILAPEIYSTLSDKKVIDEAASKSGVSRGILQAAWEAIGSVIKAWATEGHSVAIPGLGTMRFGVNATSVDNVNMVASSLITSRKVIFTPSVDIKEELKSTAVQITCIDRNGNVVKRVNSGNSEVEGDTFKLTLLCNSAQGTVNGAGSYPAGTEVQISAVGKGNFAFKEWSDGNTSATRTITLNADMELTASFIDQDNPLGGNGGSTPGGNGGSTGGGNYYE